MVEWANATVFVNGFIPTTSTNNSIPIFLANTDVGTSIACFISGEGSLQGGLHLSSSITIFVARDTETLMNTIPIFCATISGQTNTFTTIFTVGGGVSTKSVNIVTPNVFDVLNTTTYLYIHGF